MDGDYGDFTFGLGDYDGDGSVEFHEYDSERWDYDHIMGGRRGGRDFDGDFDGDFDEDFDEAFERDFEDFDADSFSGDALWGASSFRDAVPPPGRRVSRPGLIRPVRHIPAAPAQPVSAQPAQQPAQPAPAQILPNRVEEPTMPPEFTSEEMRSQKATRRFLWKLLLVFVAAVIGFYVAEKQNPKIISAYTAQLEKRVETQAEAIGLENVRVKTYADLSEKLSDFTADVEVVVECSNFKLIDLEFEQMQAIYSELLETVEMEPQPTLWGKRIELEVVLSCQNNIYRQIEDGKAIRIFFSNGKTAFYSAERFEIEKPYHSYD